MNDNKKPVVVNCQKMWDKFGPMFNDYHAVELLSLSTMIASLSLDKFLGEIKEDNPDMLNDKFKQWLSIVEERAHSSTINVFKKRMKEWGFTVSKEFKDIKIY